MLNFRTRTLLLFIFIAVLARLLPWPPNFSPIGALALFAGHQFLDRRLAYAVPLVVLFLSDLVLGLHPTMWAVYLAFALCIAVARAAREQRQWWKIGTVALTNSVLFFVISNLGVWLTGELYSQDLTGLLTCFVAALPFFDNTVGGTLFFTVCLFGTWQIMQAKWPELAQRQAL